MKKRDNNKVGEGVTEKKPQKEVILLVFLPYQDSSAEVIIVLPHTLETNDSPIQRTHIKADFDEKYVLFGSKKNILDKVIFHVKQRFKIMEEFRFVKLLNPKKKKISDGSVFNFRCI